LVGHTRPIALLTATAPSSAEIQQIALWTVPSELRVEITA
jgi:hypothetical protein